MKAFVLRNRATGAILNGPRRALYSRKQDAVANVPFVLTAGNFVEVVEYHLGQPGSWVVATYEKRGSTAVLI